MSKVKKQHFVPQFYLRNFTDSKNCIYAFDIVKDESFSASTENIAHQKYFYDYEPLDQFIGREQAIEKALANSEAEQAIVLRKLVAGLKANDVSALTKDDYRQLADYIITQQKRTPESRVTGSQVAIEMERQLKAKESCVILKIYAVDTGFFGVIRPSIISTHPIILLLGTYTLKQLMKFIVP